MTAHRDLGRGQGAASLASVSSSIMRSNEAILPTP